MNYQSEFYRPLAGNKVQCRLCNHFCVLENNKLGKCNARKNENGKLISLVYGKPVALNIDPVEKKPLFHFMPGTMTYSLGTLGCNFRCANCQNWDISQEREIEKKARRLDYVDPEKIVEEALNNECKSISYTYNEPAIFVEYALDIMKIARDNDLKNIWVSNGFMSGNCLDAVLPYLDAANIDLKSMDDDFYQNNCGANVKPVLENLKTIRQSGIHLEIATLVIPTLSDNEKMLGRLADFIVSELDMDVPWHLSKFSPEISWKLKNLPSTNDYIIYQAYEIGKDAGLKYIYTGNMPGDQKENTYCPKCGELAIRRFGYQIERMDIDGRCADCDKNLDIVE